MVCRLVHRGCSQQPSGCRDAGNRWRPCCVLEGLACRLDLRPCLASSFRRRRPSDIPFDGTWDVTVWDAPSYVEWTQTTGGATSVAGHRVESLGEGRARLTLTLDTRGFLIPIFGRFYKDLTNRYMNLEAEGMKRAAESA
jgi:hypothetical protein